MSANSLLQNPFKKKIPGIAFEGGGANFGPRPIQLAPGGGQVKAPSPSAAPNLLGGPTVGPRPTFSTQGGGARPTGVGGQVPTLQDFVGAGKAGEQSVMSVTGRKKKPGSAFVDELAFTGADEARNFRFDLPDAQFGESVQGLLGLGESARAQSGQAQADRQTALGELNDLQQRALSPELSPEQRQFFQNMADERRADILTRFGPGGDISNVFERQGAASTAQLANRGVLDTTTGAQAFARRDTDLAALANQLLGQAAEQSRQDVLGERGRIGQTATQFGGLQGQQAIAAGQLANALLGTGAGALQGAGQLDIAGREQLAGQQLAEVGQRLLGNQTALQNIQSLRNQRKNRQALKQQMDLQRQLVESQLGGGSFLSMLGMGGDILGQTFDGKEGIDFGQTGRVGLGTALAGLGIASGNPALIGQGLNQSFNAGRV